MLDRILRRIGLVVLDKREAVYLNAVLLSASPRDAAARNLRWKLSAIIEGEGHGPKTQ